MNISEIVELIAKKYNGALSPENEIALQRWGEKKKENQQLLEYFSDKEVVRGGLEQFNSFDETRGWKEIKMRFKNNKVAYLQTWVKYAAVVVVVSFLSIATWRLSPLLEEPRVSLLAEEQAEQVPISSRDYNAILNIGDRQVVIADSLEKIVEDEKGTVFQVSQGKINYLAHDAPKEDVDVEIIVPIRSEYQFELSDGTKLRMNAGSRVKFKYPLMDERRSIEIEGEVFLSVAKDANRPFVVYLPNGNCINVLGTEFNVRAYPEDKQISAVLIEGEISWKSASEKEWIIEPGQLLTCNKVDESVEICYVNAEQYTAWKDGKFYYSNKPLVEILTDISRWYGVEFKFENEDLERLRMSLDVKRYSNMQEILEIFELTGKLGFQIEGSSVMVLSRK